MVSIFFSREERDVCLGVFLFLILLFFSFLIFCSKILSSCSDSLLSLLEVAEVFAESEVFCSSECDLFLFVLVCGRLSRSAVSVTVYNVSLSWFDSMYVLKY